MKKKVLILVVLLGLLLVGLLIVYCKGLTENFTIKDMLKLNKSAGNTTVKNGTKVSENAVKLLKSDTNNTDDFKQKIQAIREHIKNKQKKMNLESVQSNDRTKLIANKKKQSNPEPFMAPSKLGAQGSCKFLASSACSKEYPVYLGASLGVPDESGMKLSCNSDLSKPAKGLAIINKGKLEAVVLLDTGEGYKQPPTIGNQ